MSREKDVEIKFDMTDRFSGHNSTDCNRSALGIIGPPWLQSHSCTCNYTQILVDESYRCEDVIRSVSVIETVAEVKPS